MDLQGTYTALITPLNDNGDINYKGFKDLIDYQLDSKVDGILVLGTTAETPTLSKLEKKVILQGAIDLIDNKTNVMVGTGTNCTKTTIEETLTAQKAGANMALVVSPYYNKPTQEGLYQHFKEVHDNTDIPLVVYNIPGRTAVNIETSTLGRIAQLERVIGVKEASGNLEQIEEVINKIAKENENFSVMSGDDSMTYPIMKNGGNGVISVVSNLYPGEIVKMVNSGLNGDFDGMIKSSENVLDIFDAAFIETNPAPIKYMMEKIGLPAGGCRLPLVELQQESKNEIDSIIGKVLV